MSITLREKSQCSQKIVTEPFQGSWINVKNNFLETLISYSRKQELSVFNFRLLQQFPMLCTETEKKATYFGLPCWRKGL